jgi:hypothetical protein
LPLNAENGAQIPSHALHRPSGNLELGRNQGVTVANANEGEDHQLGGREGSRDWITLQEVLQHTTRRLIGPPLPARGDYADGASQLFRAIHRRIQHTIKWKGIKEAQAAAVTAARDQKDMRGPPGVRKPVPQDFKNVLVVAIRPNHQKVHRLTAKYELSVVNATQCPHLWCRQSGMGALTHHLADEAIPLKNQYTGRGRRWGHSDAHGLFWIHFFFQA